MCGICGQFNYLTRQPVEPRGLERMTRAIIHRGPDDEGYYRSGNIGLGFRRLSIIDLSGGHQPMGHPDGSIWVVFNGEIYNFHELRSELESHGHIFRTSSDTEVIVHGFKEWGDSVLEHLRGMFGVGIWDERKRRLILARDRMGIKPIYYKIEDGQLLFGSEIRAILASEGNHPEIDPAALNLFLRFRYTPSPLTLLQKVRKLAAGTCLVVQEGSEPRIERYWNFSPEPFESMPSDEEATEKLLELYSAAVKRQLMSDVPLGLLLSGGMDSALLLALMQRHGNSWQTYTVGYGTSFQDDELSDAAQTAKILGASNVQIHLDRETFESSFEAAIRSVEEPVATSSIVPMYFISQRARQDVKVAFMGQGPDELLAGYTRHLGLRYSHYWRALPSSARFLLGRVLRTIPRNESIRRGLHSLDAPERMIRYEQVFSLLPASEIDGLFQPGVLPPETERSILDCWHDLVPLMQKTDDLGGLQFLEVRSSLPDELLIYGDKLSMAHGLEIRVPFLDQEIVEYVERLGASFKVRFGKRKWLHRKVAERFLPPEILNRKKRGFATNVVDQWFRESLSMRLDEVLRNSESLIYQYLRLTSVEKLLQDHRKGRADNHKILFSLVVLEQCLRQYQGTPAVTVA
jgi:asparagine synthase (glutamine-hydrolysing)